ncbi:MAG: hypothetical protein HGA65_03445 [Oscillochloris sp.]|nr:hypothetical protein [Oscillochloris sp.]
MSGWIEKAWGGRDNVKPSPAGSTPPRADYVAHGDEGTGRSIGSHPEPEREPEREPAEPAPLPRPAIAGTLYTEEQLEKRDRLSRDKGAAEALGLVLGMGLVPESREAEIMAALFGPRGRRHQVVRPIIAAAVEAATPKKPAPPITVYGGTEREFELPRLEGA